MFRLPVGLLASPIVPTAAAYRRRAAEALYVRAEQASLPPHIGYGTHSAQAIGGVGTYTHSDSQPCRLLQCNGMFQQVAIGG
jgi:hypothetical protein